MASESRRVSYTTASQEIWGFIMRRVSYATASQEIRELTRRMKANKKAPEYAGERHWLRYFKLEAQHYYWRTVHAANAHDPRVHLYLLLEESESFWGGVFSIVESMVCVCFGITLIATTFNEENEDNASMLLVLLTIFNCVFTTELIVRMFATIIFAPAAVRDVRSPKQLVVQITCSLVDTAAVTALWLDFASRHRQPAGAGVLKDPYSRVCWSNLGHASPCAGRSRHRAFRRAPH